jgi:hypothetical protein
MAEENTVVERLEIQLGYSEFISSLRGMTNAYHTALDKINNMGAGVGKAIVQSSKLVQDTVNSLSNATANSVKNAFGSVEANLNNTHTSVRNLSRQISADLKALDILSEQKGRVIAQRDKELSRIKDVKASGAISKQDAGYLVLKAQMIAEEGLSKLDAKATSVREKMYKSMSELGVQSAQTFSNTTAFAANSISKIAIESKNTLNTLFKTTGDVAKDVESIASGKQIADNIVKQRQNLTNQLASIEQQRIKTKEAADLAHLAFNKQTNEQEYKNASESHQKAGKELTSTLENQKKAITYHNELGDTITSTYNKIPEAVGNVRNAIDKHVTNIKEKSTNIGTSFEKTFERMNKSVAAFGTLGIGDIKNTFQEFANMKAGLSGLTKILDVYIESLNKIKNIDPGVKKLIGELTESKNKLIEQRRELVESAKSAGQLNFTGSLSKSQEKLSQFHKAYSQLYDSITKQKISFAGQDFSSSLGITEGLKNWKEIKNYSQQMGTLLGNIRKEITTQERAQSELELRITETTNEAKKRNYKAYVEAIKTYISELQARLTVYGREINVGRGLKDTLVANAQEFKQAVVGQISGYNNVKEQLASMKKVYEDTRASSMKYSDSNVKMTQEGVVELKRLATSYLNTFKIIKEQINNLTTLQKEKALSFNATKEIEVLKILERQYAIYAGQVKNMMTGVTKFGDVQARQLSKSWATNLWEGLRNFRWQVAGLIYLISRAIQGIRSSLIDTFEEISNYRKSIYALTANIGMTVGPQVFKESFGNIFEYSRELMDKLQAQSAYTYATLEDLVMVTRSFAQSGIFPKTDQDIERIGTLATAVKVMTEGMANEGVQMRQEIMALIEGRTRVTDTLARSLKMFGIDIKKSMEEWDTKGISRLEGFASLFSQFAEINKNITNEYTVQVTRLETMWKWIKRIAGESLVLQIAKDLSRLTTSLGDLSKGNLTELGKNVSLAVRTWLLGLYETMRFIGSIFLSVGSFLMDLDSVFNDVLVGSDKIRDSLSGWGKEIYDFLSALYSIESGFAVILESIKATVYTIVYGGKGFINFFTGGNDAFDKWNAAMKSVDENMQKIGNTYNEKMSNLPNKIKDLEKAFGNLDNNIKKSVGDQIDYGSSLVAINKRMVEMEEIGKKYTSKEDKGQVDIESIIKLWEAGRKTIYDEDKKLKEQMVNNEYNTTKLLKNNLEQRKEEMISSMYDVDKKIGEAIKDVSTDIENSVSDNVSYTTNLWNKFLNWAETGKFQIAGTVSMNYASQGPAEEGSKALEKNRLEAAKRFNAAIAAEDARAVTASNNILIQKKANLELSKQKLDEATARNIRKVQEKLNAGSKTEIDMWKQYTQFLEDFGSVNPYNKLTYQYWDHLAAIKKAAQENTIVQEHEAELVFLATKNWLDKIDELRREDVKNWEKWWDDLWNVEENELVKLENKYKELVNKELAAKKGDMSPELEKWIRENAKIAEQNALYWLKYERGVKLEEKRLDILNAQAKLAELGINYLEKQIYQIKLLEAEYQKWYVQQTMELNKLQRQNDPFFEEYKKIFQKENEYTKQILEEQKTEVWNPFYKDLKEMQKGWADSFSTTFTDILFDATDFGTKIKDLFIGIAKSMVQSFAKNEIFQPLLDNLKFGNIFTGFAKWFKGPVPESAASNISELIKPDGSITNPYYVIITSGKVPASTTPKWDQAWPGETSSDWGGFGWDEAWPGETEVTDSFDELSNTTEEVASSFANVNSASSVLTSSFLGSANSLLSLITGGGGGGGLMGLAGLAINGIVGYFSGGSAILQPKPFAEGGLIKEPIFGTGLNTGKNYSFGEKEAELITPMSKLGGGSFSPNIRFDVKNNTDKNISMEQSGKPYMSNEDYIVGVVINAAKTNPRVGKQLGQYINNRG